MGYTFTFKLTDAEYLNLEADIINEFMAKAKGAKVVSECHGIGQIKKLSGFFFDQLTVKVRFENVPRKSAVIYDKRLLVFQDPELVELYDKLCAVHAELTYRYKSGRI